MTVREYSAMKELDIEAILDNLDTVTDKDYLHLVVV